MEIKVRYEEGIFRPLQEVKGIREGEEFEIHVEREEWNRLAMANKSFEFLKNEPEIYTEDDIIEHS